MRSAPHRRDFLRQLGTAAMLGLATRGLTGRGNAAEPAVLEAPNARIKADRDVALGVLKPSARDLEHGLRLHAESLVFESYGFAPRAAIDGDRFAAIAATGAGAGELNDLREEMSMTRWATDAAERKEFLAAMRAAGVTCVFQNTGEEGNDPLRLMKRLARFTYATDVARADCPKAVSADDILEAKRLGRHCLCFTTNGVPLPQDWTSARDELRMIRLFHQLGVRMMHVTYNRRNPLGDGVGEPSDGGLSDFGRQAVAEMNRVGVIVDVSHSGWRTSLEAAKASAKPMVASHTTCAGLYRHFRSKPDDVIKAVCDTDGLIGICVIPRFLGGAGDISSFLDHLDYAIRKFGAGRVAIGMDVSYVSSRDAAERAKLPKNLPRMTEPGWEHLWPQDKFVAAPHAERSLAWTNWPLFTVGMVQRGHDDATIRKVLGENMLRVLRANQVG